MKLTNDHRDLIIALAQDDVFKARKATLAKESNALAFLAYENLYPLSIQVKMEALPPEFFQQTSTMFILCPGKNESKIQVNLTSSKRIAAHDNEWKRPCWQLAEGSKTIARVKKLVADSTKLDNDKHTFKTELAKFLRQITTVKKLQDAWPEGLPYYKNLAPAKVENPPAIIPDNINEMILSMRGS
jgi:hypothetical protein